LNVSHAALDQFAFLLFAFFYAHTYPL
jgi:hypothetical protein